MAGAIATFADAQVVAVLGAPVGWRRHTPTISLSVDYLAPVAIGAWLEAEVTLSKQTPTMLFTQALMTVDDETVARSSANLSQQRAYTELIDDRRDLRRRDL